jgi:carbon-monoxide dehydrogenase medium subunit
VKPFEYRAPETLSEALALLAEHGDDAKLIAGGTALVILMKQDLVQPAVLIDLRQVPGLNRIAADDEALAIGALTTHRDMERAPLVRSVSPALSETFSKVATIRVRTMATLGGNLVHGDPSLDPPVTLLALGASVRLVGPDGERTLPLDELFVDYYETAIEPTEILTEIQIPFLPRRSRATFLKFTPRTQDDYGTVTVAVRLTADRSGSSVEDVRIALGAVGPTCLRAIEAEAALRGQRLGDPAFREAAALARDAADPISDLRGTAEYKRDMVEVFVRRALIEAHAAMMTGDRDDERDEFR